VPPAPRAQNLLLVRAGLFIGLAASFKLTNLPVLPAAALVAGLAPLLPSRIALPRRACRAIWAAALFSACALIPLAPWLLKNIYFFGVPFYPIALTVNSANAPLSAAAAA